MFTVTSCSVNVAMYSDRVRWKGTCMLLEVGVYMLMVRLVIK